MLFEHGDALVISVITVCATFHRAFDKWVEQRRSSEPRLTELTPEESLETSDIIERLEQIETELSEMKTRTALKEGFKL